MPGNDNFRHHVKNIISTCFKLMEIDNEENVVLCLRIVIELHKTYRPPFTPDVQQFLMFVKGVYKELPTHLDEIFQPKEAFHVRELSELDIPAALKGIYAVTTVITEKKNPDGTVVTVRKSSLFKDIIQTQLVYVFSFSFQYNLLPRSHSSVKVFQELPVIVVLMYQIYKNNVQSEVTDFIPIVMSTISLQPSMALQ